MVHHYPAVKTKPALTSSHEDDTRPKSWVIGRQAHVDTLGASCLQGVAKGGEPWHSGYLQDIHTTLQAVFASAWPQGPGDAEHPFWNEYGEA